MPIVRRDCYCGQQHKGEEHQVDALVDYHKKVYEGDGMEVDVDEITEARHADKGGSNEA